MAIALGNNKQRGRIVSRQYLAFSQSYTIICYDTRFHGGSSLTPEPFDCATGHSKDDLTDDVLKMLNYLNIMRIYHLQVSTSMRQWGLSLAQSIRMGGSDCGDGDESDDQF
ncbi:hypothetical protein CC80DRAFT_507894 [Byssothecium circinans]|uniref:Uncharacterized protein n=1 Tax=Byssothecium circinans TaxID=147558 RepID=A0A6A5TPJ0_9PLEO|nr:hypothetical protein CC80DRAFT_507894 [Byssothecium circinans]